jgi:hypothetical protein
MASRLGNIQTVHTRCAFVRLYPLERPLQVLSRQRRPQQRRPCAPGVMARTARFVADRIARGFTARFSRPPRWRGRLTHYVLYRHGLEHFSSFGPSLPAGSYYSLC